MKIWPHESRQVRERNMVYKRLQIILLRFTKILVSFPDATEIIELKQIDMIFSSILIGVLTSACGAAPSNAGLANDNRQTATTATGKNVTTQASPINQRYRNLDDYLAYLEQYQGPVDGPWYKEVSPGLYELQTGNLKLDVPGEQKRNFTRDELEKKFGFKK